MKIKEACNILNISRQAMHKKIAKNKDLFMQINHLWHISVQDLRELQARTRKYNKIYTSSQAKKWE